MKRSIIKIDENKCNGCGLCVPACHEGAIKIVNGKARLSGDALCDGLGACLGECPQGAIMIEEREADIYNEIQALENIIQQGSAAVQAHLKHLADHGQADYLKEAEQYLAEKGGSMEHKEEDKPMACGCPGSMTRDFSQKDVAALVPEAASVNAAVTTELQQWPVQLRLLNPRASFFQNAELVVCADCVPFTYADFHRKFLKGRALIVFCPKLDENLEEYIEKISEIFRINNIKSVTIVRMEVPCCGGILKIVEEAVRRSGKGVILRESTISLRGEII